jgi:hypothetical protein
MPKNRKYRVFSGGGGQLLPCPPAVYGPAKSKNIVFRLEQWFVRRNLSRDSNEVKFKYYLKIFYAYFSFIN